MRTSSVHQVEIPCKVLHETTLALYINDGKISAWVPRSQITDECEEQGKITSIFLPDWLAVAKGLA